MINSGGKYSCLDIISPTIIVVSIIVQTRPFLAAGVGWETHQKQQRSPFNVQLKVYWGWFPYLYAMPVHCLRLVLAPK